MVPSSTVGPGPPRCFLPSLGCSPSLQPPPMEPMTVRIPDYEREASARASLSFTQW